METDNQIREFIVNNYPEVNDSGKFLAELQQKLVILDQAQTIYRKESEKTHRCVVAAFTVGAIFGAASILSCIFCPNVSFGSFSSLPDLVINVLYQGRFFLLATIISIVGLAVFIRKSSKAS